MIFEVNKFDLIYDYVMRISLFSFFLYILEFLFNDNYYLKKVFYFASKNFYKLN